MKLWFILTLFLLSSFLLHMFPIEHEHPHDFGAGVQAALHGENRKYFIVLVLFVYALWVVPRMQILNQHVSEVALTHEYNPLNDFFRRGIFQRRHYD